MYKRSRKISKEHVQRTQDCAYFPPLRERVDATKPYRANNNIKTITRQLGLLILDEGEGALSVIVGVGVEVIAMVGKRIGAQAPIQRL